MVRSVASYLSDTPFTRRETNTVACSNQREYRAPPEALRDAEAITTKVR